MHAAAIRAFKACPLRTLRLLQQDLPRHAPLMHSRGRHWGVHIGIISTGERPLKREEGVGTVEIRKSTERDLERIMDIYAAARAFMAAHGNPNQWGPTNWPPEALIRRDIAQGKSYVCVHEGAVAGVFFFDCGKDIEPTYAGITDGQWLDGSSYGVVHRIAADGTVKGVGAFCIGWAFEQCHHLRIDTHGDNRVMQRLLEKLGFVRCGTIYVEEDPYPRLAYEKTAG